MLPLLFKGECQAKCFFTKLLYIILFHPIFGFSLNPFDHYCQLLFFVLPSILTHSSIITFIITPDRDTITRLALINACYERPRVLVLHLHCHRSLSYSFSLVLSSLSWPIIIHS